MTEIQQGRYDALLRRAADLKGPGSKVNDVLEELFPTIDVENVPGELLWLMGTRMCMGGGTEAAIANEAGRVQLHNPAGSGYIITITSVHFATQSASTIRWGLRNVSYAEPLQTEIFRDHRGGLSSPVGQIHSQTSVALANAQGQTRINAAVDFELKDPNGVAVLSPNTGWEIGNGAVNTAVFFAIYWRERIAEPSELNF